MYYRDKDGNKIDDKIIKENYSVSVQYSLYIYFASVFLCLILAVIFKDKLPIINITLLPFVSKDIEKIIVIAFIAGLLLGLIINSIVYRS